MTEEKIEIYTYKILILGNTSVGKTSFLIRFCDAKFVEDSLTTIGVDWKKKFIKRNNKNIKLNIMDTAGQERFRAIAKNMFKNAHGIILMYDVTNEQSFFEIKDWINSIKENVDIEKIGIVIVGNKIDLKENIKINNEMKTNFENKYSIKIYEASAKDNINVNETFIDLVDKIQQLGLGEIENSSLEAEDNEINNKNIKLNKNNDSNKNYNKKSCCVKKQTNK